MKKSLYILLFLGLFQGCVSQQDLVSFRQLEIQELCKGIDSSRLESQIEINDAVYTVIHIRQQHDSQLYTDFIQKSLKATSDKEALVASFYQNLLQINKVQKEVYDFLMGFSTPKHRIYSEGMVYPNTYRNLFADSFKEKRLEEINGILSFAKERSYSLPKPSYFLGASFLIHQQGDRNLLGAEHAGILKFTLATYSNEHLQPKVKFDLLQECHEQRENEILKNIIKNDEELPYRERRTKFVIMGSSHDFKNNVQEWNKQRPLLKMNLMTFTPTSLKVHKND